MAGHKIAVVGAGIHGLSTARCLAERGHKVTLYDSWPEGHERGSSHGRSRIIRRAYPDPFYTQCMQAAYPLWKRLERASGTQLVHEVGLLYFGNEESANLSSVVDGLNRLRVTHEIVGKNNVAAIFPSLELMSDEQGVFTPEAGWVDAELAISVTAELAKKAGCVRQTKTVRSADLESYEKVVLCPGAWVRYWWPTAPVTVSLQTTAYVAGRVTGPVWIEDSPDLLYGFPSEGAGVKIGVHAQGPKVDPNSWSREPNKECLDLIRAFATKRLGISNPNLQEAKGCLYTNTPTEDFLMKRINERTFLVSACSGHGFKFGPWIGQTMADLVEERVSLKDFPRFGRE